MLTKLALKRPVAIVVSLIALVVFGFSALLGTPLELTPSMSMPMYIIVTVYPGAGPEEVEDLVSTVIVDSVSTLQGLKKFQSQSMESQSMVMLQMEYGTDMDKTNNEIQKRLNSLTNALPDEATTPTLIEMTMDSQPIIQMSVKATGDMDLLTYVNENIVPDFEKLNGVAQVEVYGGHETYMRVCLSPEKMKQYGLDMNTVSNMIASADFSLPAGSVDQGDLSLILRGGVSYKSATALGKLPITLKTGDIIHLSDIAEIGEANRKSSSISRYDGEETISISITKRDSASTNGVTGTVEKMMDQINAQARGVQLEVTYNATDEIWESLVGVIQAMALAIVISMVILFLFLGDIRASFIIGTSMPVSVLVTLIVMSFSGMTFNMLSLGGLTIGVGMMVDNSIVVLDSCFKKRGEHRSFMDAAIEGAGLVTSAVIASTLTTVVVFLPIATMQGMSGQLFKDAGFTVVFALLASLISSITLVPLLFFRFKPKEKREALFSRGLRRVEQYYGVLIKKSLSHRVLVVLAAVALLVGSFMMLPFIGVELMPSTDNGQINVAITTRPGLRLENARKIMDKVEAIVLEQPDLEHYSLSGSGESSSFTLYLKDDRTVETAQVMDNLRQATKGMLDCEVKVSSGGISMGSGSSDTVQDMIISSDQDKLSEAADMVKAEMYKNPGIVNVTTSLSSGSPQAEIVVDPVKSGTFGLTPVQVMSSVSMMVSGKEAATIRMGDRDYSVRVEYPEGTYQKVSDLAAMDITAPSGISVPLLDVARIEYSNSPQAIMRENNQYVVSITGQSTTKDALKVTGDVRKSIMSMQLPDGVSHYFGGQTEMMNEEFGYMFGALGTAIFLVFMVMAIQFNSMRFSLMVMLSVPFSLIGAFGGLLLTGTSISMTSLMGFILLVGIVVNNAIVLIDYVNLLREGGMKVRNALIKAGRSRLRPILMTTLTTVLGMVPMAVGMGANAEMMRGMAMVVIGGLSASTVLTLVLIPTFYLIFSKRDSKNPNLKDDDTFDPEKPKIEYPHSVPEDLNQSDEFPEADQPI